MRAEGGEVERLWILAGAVLTLGLGLAFGNMVLGTAVGVYATGIAVWAAESTGRSLRRLEEVGAASHIGRVIDVL